MTDTQQQGPYPVLEIKNLHKNFGDLEVLKGIDLAMNSGEVYAFIGASGSGKTTLLRCVNLLEEFHQGTIRLEGDSVGYKTVNGRRVLLKEKQIALQRAMTGMVFQNFNLFPHMTAEENIMLGLTKVKRKNISEARRISDQWLERVGLVERKTHYPAELSGGQQQRVAIARAVALEPKLLLLDEVTSALDPELIGEVLKVIKDLASEGMTMMIVTHEMSFAEQVATQVFFMNEGRIEESGPPDQILINPSSPRLVNFLSGFSKTG